ncbi:uncharacterized protein IL334_007396 [Kwoniella shivajii]|uniref:Uncharacterized protein n=1 Tax=Kwoniella shivajii TaxID=564305 RepID=A0ABZ1D918_9TREE|nr:hypothetical protein IL334_007396 [Kwoniella shivajii]
MEGNIDNAKQFLNSEQGQEMKQQLFDKEGNQPTGDPQTDSPSYDYQGNEGEPGQYGQEGQFGAVTGKGFGGGFSGNNQDQNQEGKKASETSAYEGMQLDDSTSSGGWGGSGAKVFNRENQMAADQNQGNDNYNDDDDHHKEGVKTGYSTPGYRREGDDDEENAKRLNQNVYGQQSDDRGSTGNDYNEANI